MASSTPSAAVNPRDVLFARGILAGLTIWPALQLAVAENWGGPNGRAKIAWHAGELIDVFVSPAPQQQRDPIVAPGGPAAPGPSPDEEYVEEMLLQVMEDEFDTVLEDGSALVVARRIVGLWSMLASDPQAAEQLVRDLEARADSIKGKRVQAQREEDEDGSTDGSSDEEETMRMDDEPVPQLFDSQQPRPKQEPVVDEDGFTLVQGKGKGRR